MAISLGFKKNLGAATPAPKISQNTAPADTVEGDEDFSHVTTSKKTTPQTSKLKFVKRGADAQAAMAREDHQAKEREEANKNKVFRFYLPDEGSSSVTFLDGELINGVLDIPYYYEHNVMMNGKWGNFYICTQDEEPCPICQGKLIPSYVGVLTVIDHSEYTSKKDNKVHRDEPRLFVAKRHTIKQLQKLSAKRGGLRGCTFDVSRIGDKSPSVGNVFDFTTKLSEAQLVSKWGEKAQPFNYEDWLAATYLSAKELRKLGFGSQTPPIGSESAHESDYSDKL